MIQDNLVDHPLAADKTAQSQNIAAPLPAPLHDTFKPTRVTPLLRSLPQPLEQTLVPYGNQLDSSLAKIETYARQSPFKALGIALLTGYVCGKVIGKFS